MTSGSVSPLYGDPSAPAPPWYEVYRQLAEAQLDWMVTVRRDGRPHAVPLCGVWRDGAFFFCTGDAEQKMRNLEHDPHVVVTAGPLGVDGWAYGKDIAVEGVATPVADDALLRELAAEWERKYAGDWRWEVRDGRFFELSDQGDGTSDGAVVFRVPPDKVLVFGDEHGQTTYRF
jgi:nitroimidazol reductase NimA-like FMN-containing flavoprotein (pyridoxamine 5'-phosphate oxidase superfamily)